MKPSRDRPEPDPSTAEPQIEDATNHRTVVGQRRSAATRARILAAAAEVFSLKGMDAPVIDDFVRAARISRGTFYNYFTTVTALLDATVEWLREDLDKSIVCATAGLTDPVHQSATAMRLYLRWATSTPVLSACVGRLPEISRTARIQARKEIVRGMELGEYMLPSVDVGCDMSFGTLSEAIRRAAREPERPFHCDDVVTVILAGYGVPKARISELMSMPLPALTFPRIAAAPAKAEVSRDAVDDLA